MINYTFSKFGHAEIDGYRPLWQYLHLQTFHNYFQTGYHEVKW